MRTTAGIGIWILRVAAIVQLVLGIAFWTGHGLTWIPVHILIGSLLVLCIWTIAVMALFARVRRGLAVLALLLGLALPAFGMPQASILVGPLHWIVRVVHLAMAVAAVHTAMTVGRAILGAVPSGGRVSNLGHGAAASRAS